MSKAQLAHVHDSCVPTGGRNIFGTIQFRRAAVRQGIASAADAEFAEQRRHGHDRGERLAAVSIALDAPTSADHRRSLGEDSGQCSNRRGHARLRRALDRPFVRRGQQRFQSRRHVAYETQIEPSAFSIAGSSPGLRANQHLDKPAGADRLSCAEVRRIHRREKAPFFFACRRIRDQMDVRVFRIRAPNDMALAIG